MPLVPIGQYRPDVSDYGGDSTQNILNVLPQGDGYGPFKDYAVFSGAMAVAVLAQPPFTQAVLEALVS